jgi:hypothetical protein
MPSTTEETPDTIPAVTEATTIETEDTQTPDETAALMDPMLENSISLSAVQSYLNDFQYNEDSTFLSCTESSLLNCQNQVANQKGLEEKSADACTSIADENMQQQCKNQLWMQLASLDNNPTLCDNISEESSVNMCKDQALNSKAIADKNSALCNDISDPYQQDSCKNQVQTSLALEALDHALCEAVVQYEYETVFPETEENQEGEAPTDPMDSEPTIVRNAVPQEQNFERQNCISQVEMAQSMAAEDAAMAEAEAASIEDTAPEE